jgi:non-specific serine/threonine protein kinase/serine/threonine-protein kinase
MLRHRAVLVAALAANIALVAGASVAGYQAYEAHRQRARAEHHFADVRKLANVMLLDVHQAIAPLPGSTPARRLIVQNALVYLQQLSAEAAGNTELLVELANGYRSIGDIQGRPYAANIGDAKGALESYDRGIALVKDIADHPDAQAALAQLYQRKGTLIGSQGDTVPAERLVARGVALMNDLASHRPLGRELQLVRAAMYGQLSQLQRYADETEAFFRNSQEARRQYQRILADAPDEETAVSGLATTYLEQGTYYFERDNEPATLALAIEAFRRALALQQPIAEKHPDNVRLLRNLAAHHANLAAALMRAQQPRDAAQAYQKAHDIIADLSGKDPANAQLRAELAIVTGSMSRALLANGDAGAAVAAAQAAVEIYAALPEGSLRDVNTRYKQGVAHYLLGQALDAARSDHRSACAAYRKSLPVLQELEGRNALGRTDITPAAVQQAMRHCA